MTPTPDHSTTSLSTIVVEKDKLISKLRENRQTHREIYEAACAGFWVQTETALAAKREEFTQASAAIGESFNRQFEAFTQGVTAKDQKVLGNFVSTPERSSESRFVLDCRRDWLPSYPTNHLEDYDSAISRLEFSVADKVSLAASDFEAYVRNNWKWKEEFANGNLGLVRCVTGFMASSGTLTSSLFNYAISGGLAL